MLEKEETIEKKKTGIVVRLMITLLLMVSVLAGIVVVLRVLGRENVMTAVAGSDELIAQLGEQPSSNSAATLQEGHILYNGQEYALNEDIITILVMGIDKETVNEIGGQSWSSDEDEYQGGQADALFLVIINPHDESIKVVAINRNAMTDVDVWGADGRYDGVYTKQVALQHGYGDGGPKSCEHQVKCVSRMFHGIKINAYAAISMDAVPELNDAVGGVTLDVLEDIVYPEYDMDLHKGDKVTLQGKKAYWYVRLRDENAFGSNEQRLMRQKQYLTAFVSTAKKQSMSDVRVAVTMYQTMQKYMVTDIDISSFTYLATEYMGYEFDDEHIYTLKGETIMGSQFEEFYIDENELEDMIVELFFEPV